PPRWFPLGPDTLRPASGPDPQACTWGCRRETAATPARSGLASAADRSGNVPLSSETHDADFGLFPPALAFVSPADSLFGAGVPLVPAFSGVPFLPAPLSCSALAACLYESLR